MDGNESLKGHTMKSQETTQLTGEYNFEGRDGVEYTVTHYTDGTSRESHDFEDTNFTLTDFQTTGLHTSLTLDENGTIVESSCYDYRKY